MLRLSPKVWASLLLHGHAFPAPSQTGCKLSAFTTAGMSHVVTYVNCALLLSAWVVASPSSSATFASVDSAARRHFPWMLLLLLAVEGVTGMVPAMYMDLAPNGKECDATRSMPLVSINEKIYQILNST